MQHFIYGLTQITNKLLMYYVTFIDRTIILILFVFLSDIAQETQDFLKIKYQ